MASMDGVFRSARSGAEACQGKSVSSCLLCVPPVNSAVHCKEQLQFDDERSIARNAPNVG